MRVLIIEDQEYPLEALRRAVETVIPEFCPEHILDIAKWYTAAEQLLEKICYDLVLLDHRMPYHNPKCTDRDPDFSRHCREIGYGLISMIKRRCPETAVIGTSSLSQGEIGRLETPPDFKISKMWGEAEEELRKVLAQLWPEKSSLAKEQRTRLVLKRAEKSSIPDEFLEKLANSLNPRLREKSAAEKELRRFQKDIDELIANDDVDPRQQVVAVAILVQGYNILARYLGKEEYVVPEV